MKALSQSEHLEKIVHGALYLKWYTIKCAYTIKRFYNGD